jgi:hypothetical protein
MSASGPVHLLFYQPRGGAGNPGGRRRDLD